MTNEEKLAKLQAEVASLREEWLKLTKLMSKLNADNGSISRSRDNWIEKVSVLRGQVVSYQRVVRNLDIELDKVKASRAVWIELCRRFARLRTLDRLIRLHAAVGSNGDRMSERIGEVAKAITSQPCTCVRPTSQVDNTLDGTC